MATDPYAALYKGPSGGQQGAADLYAQMLAATRNNPGLVDRAMMSPEAAAAMRAAMDQQRGVDVGRMPTNDLWIDRGFDPGYVQASRGMMNDGDPYGQLAAAYSKYGGTAENVNLPGNLQGGSAYGPADLQAKYAQEQARQAGGGMPPSGQPDPQIAAMIAQRQAALGGMPKTAVQDPSQGMAQPQQPQAADSNHYGDPWKHPAYRQFAMHPDVQAATTHMRDTLNRLASPGGQNQGWHQQQWQRPAAPNSGTQAPGVGGYLRAQPRPAAYQYSQARAGAGPR